MASPSPLTDDSTGGSHGPLVASQKDAADNKLAEVEKLDEPSKFQPTPKFWAILATLCVIGLLSALENTVVTTSLPFIVKELKLGENYIWVTNVFFLTSAAVQPLFGQLANVFGRRWVTMSIVALFTLGSGIAGGATNGAMLIAGRAIQGMGSGGINMIVDVIISDLVPLRERGNYMAFVLIVYFVGMALGPYVGGALVDSLNWRWVGGVSMVMIFLFLRVQSNKEMSFAQKLRRIDYVGNLLLIASTVSILYALTYGGALTPWSSWRIILPLVVGLVGLGVFMFFETLKFVKEPVMPPRIFGNRTSIAIFAVTFLNSALLYWIIFFLPVYFQALLGASPARSGVLLLPAIVVGVPGAAGAVILLSKFGRYKLLHLIGFGTFTLGVGLFVLFDKDTPLAQTVVFQMIAAGGSGFVLNTLLPAVQAQNDEKDQAAITAAWSFVRSFGAIWGVAIPAAVFNNRFSQLLYLISDPQVVAIFNQGDAYQYGTAKFLDSFPLVIKNQIISVYTGALKQVWQLGIVFSGVSFLLVFLEKETRLRTELESEFGLEKDKSTDAEIAETK
ncbi:putative multidrug resistance protein fnx1 protein [Venustampulla echinocandica]|uniref:Putative multidrug resistance protein fnx1 protein n=1 Tax=Venustampulla echinocandica TaxID=2656787 RepID=A0A370TKK9_9HELO|nr:putative multidrug resistance protein fnx1 protein [Venustampulla echinocandica]RDL36049.1 putative multidrug resistance protein fnx1 protein [Venustampulla echinocandica]